MDANKTEAIARKLFNANQARERFAPLRGDDEPATLEDAYKIQDALYRIMLAETKLDKFGGHKIALTSPDIQAMCGVDQPAYGGLFVDNIFHTSHEPIVADYIRVGFEFEVAFELAEDVPLDQAPFTRETIAPFVKAAMPALEMIDDRDADYADLDAKSILADCCWNGGIVLGKPVYDWQSLDIGNLKSHVEWNGETVDHGNTGNALGHPLEGLAWIANHLAKRDGAMTKGQVVMTGSALKTLFPKAGDKCIYKIEGLGAVVATGR